MVGCRIYSVFVCPRGRCFLGSEMAALGVGHVRDDNDHLAHPCLGKVLPTPHSHGDPTTSLWAGSCP